MPPTPRHVLIPELRILRKCPGGVFAASKALEGSDLFCVLWCWCLQEIEALFKQLPLTLDLSEVYSIREPSGPQLYRLRCMVCFYGQHYVLLAYKPRVRLWVQYDDTSVKEIGDWGAVEKLCKAGRFQ